MLGGIGKMRPCGHHHYYKYAHAKNQSDLLAIHGNITNYTDDHYDNCWGPFSLESMTSFQGNGTEKSIFGNPDILKFHAYIPNVTKLNCAFYDYGSGNRPQSDKKVAATASKLQEIIFDGVKGEQFTTGYYMFRGTDLIRIPDWIDNFKIGADLSGLFYGVGGKIRFGELAEGNIDTIPYHEIMDKSSLFGWFTWFGGFYGDTPKKENFIFDEKYTFPNATSAQNFNAYNYASRLVYLPPNLSFKKMKSLQNFSMDGTLLIFDPKDEMLELETGDGAFYGLKEFYPSKESYSLPKLKTANNMFGQPSFECRLDAPSIIKFCNAIPKWEDGASHKVTIYANPDTKYDPQVNLALKSIDKNYVPYVELPIDESTGQPTEITEDKGWTLTHKFAWPCTEKEVLPPTFVERLELDSIELPEGFTRLAYLESDDQGQYIDTGYIATSKTGLYIAAKNNAYWSDLTPRPMGSAYNDTTQRMSALYNLGYLNGKTCNHYYWWNGSQYSVATASIGTNGRSYESWLNFQNDLKMRSDCDGVIYNANLTSPTVTHNTGIKIFTTIKNSGAQAWRGRIYRAKISESSEIVMDFVPALDANGEPCMYDIIGQQTYYNQRSLDFSAGNIVEEADDNIVLPENYTRLDYLQNDGWHVINTEIKANHETGAKVKWSATSWNGGHNYIMGSWGIANDWGTDGAFVLPYRVNSNTAIRSIFISKKLYTQNNTVSALATDTIYESSLNFNNDKKVILNNEILADIPNDLPKKPRMSEMYLFGINQQSHYNKDIGLNGRIYRAQITQGSELIRDFIPALDPNGKTCMYDIVNDKPYYSMNQGFKYKLATEL